MAARHEARGRRGAARPKGKRCALHHTIIAGNLAYGAWRDGGLTVHDISDPAQPKLIAHRNWSPPFGGGTHTPLPLPDRNLLVVADEATSDELRQRHRLHLDDRRARAGKPGHRSRPCRRPREADYCAKGGKFGPHNLHENRPGALQSSDLIFATYHNAGVRVFDIANDTSRAKSAIIVPPDAGADRRHAPEGTARRSSPATCLST